MNIVIKGGLVAEVDLLWTPILETSWPRGIKIHLTLELGKNKTSWGCKLKLANYEKPPNKSGALVTHVETELVMTVIQSLL